MWIDCVSHSIIVISSVLWLAVWYLNEWSTDIDLFFDGDADIFESRVANKNCECVCVYIYNRFIILDIKFLILVSYYSIFTNKVI